MYYPLHSTLPLRLDNTLPAHVAGNTWKTSRSNKVSHTIEAPLPKSNRSANKKHESSRIPFRERAAPARVLPFAGLRYSTRSPYSFHRVQIQFLHPVAGTSSTVSSRSVPMARRSAGLLSCRSLFHPRSLSSFFRLSSAPVFSGA